MELPVVFDYLRGSPTPLSVTRSHCWPVSSLLPCIMQIRNLKSEIRNEDAGVALLLHLQPQFAQLQRGQRVVQSLADAEAGVAVERFAHQHAGLRSRARRKSPDLAETAPTEGLMEWRNPWTLRENRRRSMCGVAETDHRHRRQSCHPLHRRR